MSVREIRGWTPATPLPRAPGFVRGVINLRGSVLPIIDLAERLGFAADRGSARHVIIVVQDGAQIIGLLVDAVSDIIALPTEKMQPTPDVACEAQGLRPRRDGDRRAHDQPDRARQRDADRGGGGRVTQALRVGASARSLSRRIRAERDDFSDIAAMIHADAGIYLPEARRRWSMRGSPSGCARSASRASATIASWSVAGRRGRAAGDADRADHQRHPLLPRAAPFRASEAPSAAAAVGTARRGGRMRLWSAACSSGQEPYSIALTMLSLVPEAAALDVRMLATDIDPHVLEDGQTRASIPTRRSPRSRALRKRYFEPASAATNGAACRRARSCAAGRLPHAQSHRRLADAGQVPRHLLPQRRDLFRRADAAAVWSKFAARLERGGALYIGHSERVTGPAAARFVSDGMTTYRLKEGAGA